MAKIGGLVSRCAYRFANSLAGSAPAARTEAFELPAFERQIRSNGRRHCWLFGSSEFVAQRRASSDVVTAFGQDFSQRRQHALILGTIRGLLRANDVGQRRDLHGDVVDLCRDSVAA